MFRKITGLLLVMLTAFVLPACNDDDDHDPGANQAQVRVLHASPDAPAVNVLVNGASVLENVDFGQGSAILNVDAGLNSIQVDGILPDATATVIGPVELDLTADTRYDIIAVNTVDMIEPLVVTAPGADVAGNMVRVQVVHAAANAPGVDVYVTAPAADIMTADPLGAFAFKGSLGPVEVPAGDYQIRVTPEGSKTVVYDSGPVTLAGGSDLSIAAITNTGNGDSPIKLVVMDGTGSTMLLDAATPASARIIHNSPDAPAVDVVINDAFDTPLLEDLAFPDFTAYVDTAPDTYNVKVTAANTTTAVINADLTLAAGQRYSIYAVNFLDAIEPVVLLDNNRRVATEARVRVVHGSPSAGEVDIYVTAPGADISGLDPALTAVPFKAESGYISLPGGTYQVQVTPTGSKDVALDSGPITIANGGIYTAVARDAAGGGLPLGLILLDDFVAP